MLGGRKTRELTEQRRGAPTSPGLLYVSTYTALIFFVLHCMQRRIHALTYALHQVLVALKMPFTSSCIPTCDPQKSAIQASK